MIYEYRTHIGNIRDVNEDSCFASEEASNIFMVADGIGGYEGGEYASQIVRDNMLQYWKEVKESRYDSRYQIEQYMRHVNYKIIEAQMDNLNLCKMGTTATIADIDLSSNIMHYGHIGDSSIFVFRDGKVIKVTKEHNESAELIAAGFVEQDNVFLGNKNKLTRYLGQREELELDLGSFHLKKGDYIVISTDGLYSRLNTSYILQIIQSVNTRDAQSDKKSLSKIVNQVLNYCLKNDGSDNITFILIRY